MTLHTINPQTPFGRFLTPEAREAVVKIASDSLDLSVLSIPTEGLPPEQSNAAIATYAAALLMSATAALPFTAGEVLRAFNISIEI